MPALIGIAEVGHPRSPADSHSGYPAGSPMTAAELSGDPGWLVRRSAGRWPRKNRAVAGIVVVMTSLADRTIAALRA